MLKHSDFLLAAQVLAGSITDALKDEDEGYFPEVTVERDERDVDREDAGAVIKFMQNGCTISIFVSKFWRHEGQICYFVNVNHPNGNFSCQSGTNNLFRATMNVGSAMNYANMSGDPIQMED
jgi:hypothetical protein